MSEQQDHLKNLVSQRQTLLGEINDLNTQAAAKRELALRASGAIEYLQQIGIELPEEEEVAPVEGEAAAAPEGETVVGDAPLPEPTVEG